MSPDTVPRQRPSEPANRGAILAVVLVYAIFASCWILLSDKLVQLIFTDPSRIILASIFKGWLFVVVTSLLLYGLMRRWVIGDTQPQPIATKSRRLGWIFIVLATVIVIFTAESILSNLNHHKQNEIAQLDAKADMKAGQIADWFRERQNNVDFILTSEYMDEHYRNWQTSGDLHSAEKLKTRLEQFRKISGFAAITLLDFQGNRLWGSTKAPDAVTADVQAVANQVAKDRKARQLDPYIDATNNVCMDFIAPLNTKHDQGAVLILHINLAESFTPILHTWSITNSDIKVLMLRRNSDQVLYINEFKNRNNRTIQLRMLGATEKGFSAKVFGSSTSPGSWVEDEDYQGLPFIGVVRAVPGTDWFLVLKRDLPVFYAQAVEDAVRISLIGLFGLFVVGAGFYLMRQNQQLLVAQALQQSQAERMQALQMLGAIADSSSDAIYAKDRDGRYILFNRAAGCIIDKPVEEVLGHDDSHIFPTEQAEMLRFIDRQIIAENSIYSEEERLSTAQGECVFHATKGPLHDADGKIIGIFGISRDVTQRKKTEAALQASEERLRLAQRSANVGIWDWDLNSGKLDWTEELETLYGYPKGTFPGNYADFLERVHPDDVTEMECLRDEAVSAHESFDFDFRIVLPSGASRWVNCKGGATYNAEGKPQRMFGVNIDITERKRAEAELQLWAQSFEQAHFGLKIEDAKTNTFLAVNPAFARQRGYSPEEMLGKSIMMVYPADLVEAVRSTIQAVDIKSHGVFETEHICKDGRRFPVMIDMTVIKSADGNPISRIAYALDISERKRAEMALTNSERRFRQLFDLAPMPLAIVNRSGVIAAVNTRLVDTFSYTLSDIPTLDAWWLLAYPDPDYRRMVMESWGAAVQYAMEQGADIPPKEYRITCKSGEVRTMLISGIIIDTDFLVTFFDVTERRAAEDALRVRERYQRAVLDNFPFMVWLKDIDGRILAVNKTYARVANVFDPDEMIGKTDLDYWEPELAEHYRADDKAVLDSGCSKTVEEEITEAGRHFWIESYKSPVELDGRIIGTVGFARDITDKKQADDRIKISETRLQLALDATRDGLWDCDLRSGQAYLTPHYYDIVGYRPEEITPDFEFFKRTVHPGDLPHVLEIVEAHLQGRIPVSNFDYRLITPSGEIKWIRGRGKVVERDARGQPLRMIGTITDISDQKAAEETLRQQSEELAQRNMELERFNRAMVGRELDMIALKQQINALSRELGLEPPYALAFLDTLQEAPKGGETS